MKSKKSSLTVDAAFMGLLLLIFLCVIFITSYSQRDAAGIFAMSLVFALMIITHFTSVTLGLILNIILIFIAVTIMIYLSFGTGFDVGGEVYFWMVISPVMTVVSHLIFRGTRQIEEENDTLKLYARKFILVDAFTGLKNGQAYQMEMPIYQRLSNRYELELLLMVWEFRYESDLKRMVGAGSVKESVRLISEQMQGMLRKEDVIYLLGEAPYRWGTMMLTRPGAEDILMERIKKKFDSMDLSDILGKNAPRLEMRIGMAAAAEEETAGELYDRAVNELQYDV